MSSKEAKSVIYNVVPRSSPDNLYRRLHDVISPILETADVVDLPASHRAAACNALCAIIEKCQASNAEPIQNEILDDSVWTRLFNIYLQRSDNAKGKSMRQVLLTLTNVLLMNQTPRSLQLREQAVSIFVEVICQRRDRIQVKPALQGLAYFLQRDVTSIANLVDLYRRNNSDPSFRLTSATKLIQDIFLSFLSWVVHHDTSLSAGHLIKSFLGSLRRSPLKEEGTGTDNIVSPLWIEPVVQTLYMWQDRIQDFKTHVFPHCFVPKAEYIRFLSYLHFGQHIYTKELLPDGFYVYDDRNNGLGTFEEFKILLAAIQTGKEMGIVRDVGERPRLSCKSASNILPKIIGSIVRSKSMKMSYACETAYSMSGCRIRNQKFASRAFSSQYIPRL